MNAARIGISDLSTQDRFDNLTVDIRQSEIAALISKRQTLVIDAKQVHDRCVEVVYVNWVRSNVVAIIVG